jgi:glutaredoxin-like protein
MLSLKELVVMLLNAENQKIIKERLAAMQNKVGIVLFTQDLECQFCRETHQLMQELVTLSTKLSLQVYNLQTNKEMVEKYAVDNIPAIVLLDEKNFDYGIRFYGIPTGYEFATLLEDILDISNHRHGFSESQLLEINKIDKPVDIKVFVTPTCPYCPSAVRVAHRLAMANHNIHGTMIEATEFPHLTQKYKVQGVPRSIINEDWFLEGAVPEDSVINKIKESMRLS